MTLTLVLNPASSNCLESCLTFFSCFSPSVKCIGLCVFETLKEISGSCCPLVEYKSRNTSLSLEVLHPFSFLSLCSVFTWIWTHCQNYSRTRLRNLGDHCPGSSRASAPLICTTGDWKHKNCPRCWWLGGDDAFVAFLPSSACCRFRNVCSVGRALGWLPTMVLLTRAFLHLPNQAKNC